jgi:hypothetical protein
MVGSHLLGFHPFIVGSRNSRDLVENLLKNDSPILFEGLHTCFSIIDKRLKYRKKLVRSHNIEHDYYIALSKLERNPMKRLYFKSEARKLERFEPVAYNNADFILGISQKDTAYLKSRYKNVIHISAFHAFSNMNIPKKVKDFSLYHGNLSVGENNEAALFLADKVFRSLNQKLIIAGNNPSVQLQNLSNELPNVVLKDNLSSVQINELIHQAKINILPTFQSTGIKLKLLAALFNGSHCLVNNQMVEGTGLEAVVNFANSANEFKAKVIELSDKKLNEQESKFRNEELFKFRNEISVKSLIELI